MSENNIDLPLQSPCENIINYDEKCFSIGVEPGSECQFDEYLHQLWNNAMDCGYFRYKLGFIETKVVPGKYNFVAQLNVNRASNRRMPEFIDDITKPFNPSGFNFTKVKNREVLFELNPTHWKHDMQQSKAKVLNLVIINVSPLELYNCLLVPDILSCTPQIMTSGGLRLAIETMLITQNQNLRIGFNSLGAFASVNHQHFHLYELKERLFLETSPLLRLTDLCYEIQDYPSEGFAFLVVDPDSVVDVVRCVMKLIEFLLSEKIAHNMFLTRGLSFHKSTNIPNEDKQRISYDAIRIFVWARQFYHGAKNDKAFNPALCELAGHFPIYSKEFFNNVSEEKLKVVLEETCHDSFVHVQNCIKSKLLEL